MWSPSRTRVPRQIQSRTSSGRRNVRCWWHDGGCKSHSGTWRNSCYSPGCTATQSPSWPPCDTSDLPYKERRQMLLFSIKILSRLIKLIGPRQDHWFETTFKIWTLDGGMGVFGPTKYPLALALKKYATYVSQGSPKALFFTKRNITLDLYYHYFLTMNSNVIKFIELK